MLAFIFIKEWLFLNPELTTLLIFILGFIVFNFFPEGEKSDFNYRFKILRNIAFVMFTFAFCFDKTYLLLLSTILIIIFYYFFKSTYYIVFIAIYFGINVFFLLFYLKYDIYQKIFIYFLLFIYGNFRKKVL